MANLLIKNINGTAAIHLPCLRSIFAYKLPNFLFICGYSSTGNFEARKIKKTNGSTAQITKKTIVQTELIISPKV